VTESAVAVRAEPFGALAYDYGSRRLTFRRPRATASTALRDEMKGGLQAPICLTWEITYGCNLACIHCLSSSGRRDPRELTTSEAMAVIDELHDLQVFYVNVGGGEPTIRPDFYELVDYSVARGVGVKFSTNGSTITAERARRLAGSDYVVVTRHNVSQLDAFASLAAGYGAQLRLTRLRPSGRGADSWAALHPTREQQVELYHWLVERPDVMTGDSFFHLSALGEPLPGLNLCGAGRVVCLVDPVGDVYACPFVLHPEFRAGSVRDPGGFTEVWRRSDLFRELRRPTSAGACASCGSFDACQGGCMAAKFFTGLPLDGPDPECVHGHGEPLLAGVAAGSAPSPGPGHSVPVRLTRRRSP
jgi:radical SAM protein with 4Fe4S-binding SPASM domain